MKEQIPFKNTFDNAWQCARSDVHQALFRCATRCVQRQFHLVACGSLLRFMGK
jgi:hypothetical protein